jgi:NAD(P)H dehydrogenase (quinone)
MPKPTILVTGAAGQTGSVVARQLLQAGHPVRALVRRRDTRSEALQARGAEVVVADMSDPETMAQALAGVQRAYFVTSLDPTTLHHAAVFAVAARDARLEQVVQMTQWLAGPSHPAVLTRQHWLADRLVSMVPGVSHTLVEPGFFTDFPYLATLPYAAHLGAYPWPYGKGSNAPPSLEDIAAVVVGALSDPARHAGKRYRPTGPELLDGPAMAASLGKALGRHVRLVPMPLALFLRAARLDGVPISVLAMLRHYARDHSEGAFEVSAPTDHVREVGGRAPETFEATARRLAATLPRGVGPTLKQFARFMLVPLVPAPPVQRYVQGLHLPAPAKPMSAMQSSVWQQEHGVRTTADPQNAAAPAVLRSTGRSQETSS